MSSLESPMTGNRECPVRRARSTTSAADSSRRTTTSRNRSVITSTAVSSVNSIELVSRVAVDSSSVPTSAERRTSAASSCGERPPDSSSRGSTPKLRSSALALPLNATISGRRALVKPRCSGATMRAVGSGRLIARFLGMSSPTTIEKPLTTMIARMPATMPPTTCPRTDCSSGIRSRRHDGRLGGVAEQDGGQRDAELGAGELGGQPAQRLQDRLAAPVVGRGLALHQTRVERHERELAGDEHRGAEREQDAQPDQEPLDQHAAPPGRTTNADPQVGAGEGRRGRGRAEVAGKISPGRIGPGGTPAAT